MSKKELYFIRKVGDYIPIAFGNNTTKEYAIIEKSQDYSYPRASDRFNMNRVVNDTVLTRRVYAYSTAWLEGKGVVVNKTYPFYKGFIVCYHMNGSKKLEDYTILYTSLQPVEVISMKKQMNSFGMSSRKNLVYIPQDTFTSFFSLLPISIEDTLKPRQIEISKQFLQLEKERLSSIVEHVEIVDEEIKEASLDEHIDNILEEIDDDSLENFFIDEIGINTASS